MPARSDQKSVSSATGSSSNLAPKTTLDAQTTVSCARGQSLSQASKTKPSAQTVVSCARGQSLSQAPDCKPDLPEGRASVLRPPRTGTRAPATLSPNAVRDPTQTKARKVAHENAAGMEWHHTIRPVLRDLARRGMSAAETGVRLADLLRRCPSLIAEGLGKQSQNTGGEGGSQSRPARELLPLPTPQMRPLRQRDLDEWFRDDALSARAKEAGTEAWLYCVVCALNVMDSHGNCVAFNATPTEAQRAALDELRADCDYLVADPEARTPTDFEKELGGKLNSYWGEPVYTAEDLSLFRVLPTLPARGIAASCDVCEIIDGQLRDQLRDPESLLLPKSEWPDQVPTARTRMRDPREWGTLANEM